MLLLWLQGKVNHHSGHFVCTFAFMEAAAMHKAPFLDEHMQAPARCSLNPSGPFTQGCCRIHEEDLHSSKVEAFFGSWRYFRCMSKASFVSNVWLVTGDLNFPFTLIPTFSRVPSPDLAASEISIVVSSGMVHFNGAQGRSKRDCRNTTPGLDCSPQK